MEAYRSVLTSSASDEICIPAACCGPNLSASWPVAT